MAAGNATIGSLRVELGLDSAHFATGLKQAQANLSGFGKSAAIAGAAIGTAIAGAAIAIGVAVKAAVDHADALGQLAPRVGVGVEALSKLEYAAKLSDLSLDSLGGGLKKLSVAMLDLAGGGDKGAAGALKNLGIAALDASGSIRPTEDVLADVAGKFAGMEDGAQKTALALAIFGKSGADLIPLLNSGKDGLAEMTAEAEALGLVVSTKTAAAAAEFNDNLDRLKSVGQGVSSQLAGALSPALASISAALVSAAKNTAVMDAVGKVLSGTIRVLATAAVGAGGVFAYFGTIVGGVASALGAVAHGQFGDAMKALDAAGAKAGAIAQQTGASIKAIWSTSGALVAASAPKVSAQFAAPIDGAGKKIAAGRAKAKAEIDKTAEDLKRAYERLSDNLLTQGEREDKQYAEDLRTLKDSLAAKLIAQEQYDYDLQRLNDKRLVAVDPFDIKGDLLELPNVANAVADTVADAAAEMERAFDDFGYAIGSTLDDLRSGDWQSAIMGIARSLGTLKQSWASLDTGGKIGAVAGVANAAGQAIGGVAGSGISGAASGAMAGFTLGGPVGAAIGAIAGGIFGLFSGSKAKKAAKAQAAAAAAEEARRKAEEEAARQLEIANQKRALEIQLLELQGDRVGALAAQREDELKNIDESNRALQEQVWKLQDAAEVAAQRHGLEIQLMRATGDELGALNSERADELKAMDASNRALQEQIYAAQDFAKAQEAAADATSAARDQLSDAIDRDRSAFEDTISRFQGFADSLRSFRESLDAQRAPNASSAEGEFRKVATLARLGNEEAMASFQGIGERFIDATRNTAKSDVENRRALALVASETSAVQSVAERHVNIAQAGLVTLNQQAETLLGINSGVLSVNAAMVDLGAKIEAQLAATTAQASVLAGASAAAAANAEQSAALLAELIAIRKATGQTSSTLQRFEGDGMPEVRAA